MHPKTNKIQSWDNRKALDYAQEMYGSRFFCPDGGQYATTANGTACTCSIHGSNSAPRQKLTPVEKSDLAQLMRQFSDMTAALTFTDEGLRAVVNVKKR